MKVKYNNGGGIGDPPKGIPSKERIRQLESLNRPMTEAERREYVSYSFNPAAGPNALFSMLAGFSPAGEALDVLGKGMAYGAGYLSRLSPKANNVLAALGVGKKARKADRDFDDSAYAGYTDAYDDPTPVSYPSDNMPFGRGELAASDMLSRKQMRESRNRAYISRMEQLKDFYGNDIPKPLVALARARKVGDQESIRRLSKQNMGEVDKLINALPEKPYNTPEADMRTSLLLERLLNK